MWKRYEAHLLGSQLADELMPDEGYFRKIVRQLHGTEIVIPAVKRFTKCTICTDFNDKLKKLKSPTLRKQLKSEREEHIVMQEDERMKYYYHRSKSRRDPTFTMSIIIDGMDQNKTALLNSRATPAQQPTSRPSRRR